MWRKAECFVICCVLASSLCQVVVAHCAFYSRWIVYRASGESVVCLLISVFALSQCRISTLPPPCATPCATPCAPPCAPPCNWSHALPCCGPCLPCQGPSVTPCGQAVLSHSHLCLVLSPFPALPVVVRLAKVKCDYTRIFSALKHYGRKRELLQSESQTPTRGQTNATRKQAKRGRRKDRK